MVMVTRSAFKRSSESWNSDISEKNIIPPWCSSGRGHWNKRDTYIKSVCPSRENIWDYLNDKGNIKRKSEKNFNKQTLIRSSKNRNTKLLIFSLAMGLIKPAIQRGYISGAKVIKGSTTKEWGGNVALWGIVPLWRVSPPPDTVLSMRAPKPADCWPFRGSYGEIIILLPRTHQVEAVSVEHLRPDTTRSAPKHFTLYGILGNGTWIKSADGEYSYNRPPKQYFSLATKNIPLTQIVFRVLSNHGNTKYTCMYRVHLYSKLN